jgi:hypothetical protein
MPRECKANNNNKINFIDGITGEKFWLTHKTVETDDIIVYQSANMKALTAKEDATKEILLLQINTGKEFITSIDPEHIVYDGKPINEDSPGWKEILANTASDILIGLTKYLFHPSSNVIKDDPHPFGKS